MHEPRNETFAEIVRRWVDVAKWAPSGGNAQNWRVSHRTHAGQTFVRLGLLDANGEAWSVMDVDGLPSVIALGSFGFSLIAAAANDGYVCRTKRVLESSIFSQSEIELAFTFEGETRTFYTNDEIRDRRTDRRAYSRLFLAEEDQAAVAAIAAKYGAVSFASFSNSTTPTKQKLLTDLSVLEKLRWQNPVLLESLLHEIAFGAEIAVTQDKIAADQLGVSKVEQFLLRVLKFVPPFRLMMKLGFHALAVHRAISVFVRECDEICFLSPKSETTFETAYDLGACLQEIWLEMHRRGVSMQPLGLPLIALSHVRHPSALSFGTAEGAAMRGVIEHFRDGFDLDFRSPTLGFRVGYPKNPERSLAPSHRRPVLISATES